MKLDDFLKCKKVRCVKERGEFLTIGKEYDVLDRRVEIKIIYDEGYSFWFDSDQFEPVLDSAENPLQNIELTPEFGAVEPVLADNSVNTQDNGVNMQDISADIKDTPKFKVGDKVYYGSEYRILTIAEFDDDGWIRPDRWVGFINDKQCCHATHENYEMLCKLYPHIEFEQPTKELTGSDLCFEKLRNGKKLVMCAVSDLSDEKAIKRLQDGDTCIRVIKDCDPAPYHFIDTHGIRHGFAVPLNDVTGEPLTESILND